MTMTPFAYGFRPFFLLSGVYAIVSVGTWLYFYSHGTSPLAPMPGPLWHAHEMLFGFVAATIAGFMLTAVPSWTGSRGFAGTPLIVLTLLWLAGRGAFFLAGSLPTAVVATAELLFLPALILALAPSLLRTVNRNTPLLVVLLAFWVADGVFLYGIDAGGPLLASTALRAALDLVLLLITVIGGRIVPAFTANALRSRGLAPAVRSSRPLEGLVIGVMALFLLADTLAPQHRLTALVAGIAAVLHLARLGRWQGLRTLDQPIGLDTARGLPVAAGRSRAEGRVRAHRDGVGGTLAARAVGRRCRHDDPRGHDPRRAGAHRQAAGRQARDRARLRAADCRRRGACLRSGAASRQLHGYRRHCGGTLACRLYAVRPGVRADPARSARRQPRGLTCRATFRQVHWRCSLSNSSSSAGSRPLASLLIERSSV
ncbi:MAG: NnrS family protein [Woeseiaceae bacterium]|nr:NnrS family protein [Woeseiaceae bacterium]